MTKSLTALGRIDAKNIDRGSVIKLPKITFPSARKLGDSVWLRINSKKGSVEGKLHLPLKQPEKLLIFEPGFPGDGSTRLEKLWLITLLKNNYTVFAVRHSGTIINGKYSNTYINCLQRQKKAERENQKLLGNKSSYTITDWLKEPYIALEVFAQYFKDIYLVGHSFGALASIFSLIDFYKDHPKKTRKIKRFVSLAGGVGRVRSDRDRILKQWLDYLGRKSTKERINIGNPKKNLQILKQAYIKNHRKGKNLPNNIELFFVSPWGNAPDSLDELCPLVESVEMITSIGRGYLIIDKTQQGDTKTGRLAHDMDNLKPQTFLKLIDKNWLPSNQISTID